MTEAQYMETLVLWALFFLVVIIGELGVLIWHHW